MAARQGSQPTRTKKRSKPVRAKPKHAKKSAASQDYALGGELGSEIGGIFLVAGGAALGFISLIQGFGLRRWGGTSQSDDISVRARGGIRSPGLDGAYWNSHALASDRTCRLRPVCRARDRVHCRCNRLRAQRFRGDCSQASFSQYVADSRSDVGGGLVGAAGAWVFLRLLDLWVR